MSRFKIGLQLISIRDEMEKDMDAALKGVAEMGYDCVEFARDYFGYPADEVRKICVKYGLEPVSNHQGYRLAFEDIERFIDRFKKTGVKYIAVPYVSPDMWIEDTDGVVKNIIKYGEILKENGIQLLFHNHDHELFMERDGKPLMDWVYEHVPVELLRPQLDICWVHYAGKNPYEYIKKYGDVEDILHLKDFECTNLPEGNLYEMPAEEIRMSPKEDRKFRRDMEADGFVFKPVGYGRQNVGKILETAEETCIKYIIVEQDKHPERTGMEDAKLSIEYIRSLGY